MPQRVVLRRGLSGLRKAGEKNPGNRRRRCYSVYVYTNEGEARCFPTSPPNNLPIVWTARPVDYSPGRGAAAAGRCVAHGGHLGRRDRDRCRPGVAPPLCRAACRARRSAAAGNTIAARTACRAAAMGRQRTQLGEREAAAVFRRLAVDPRTAPPRASGWPISLPTGFCSPRDGSPAPAPRATGICSRSSGAFPPPATN